MDEMEFGNGGRIGSVKAAIDRYGGKFSQSTYPVTQLQKSTTLKPVEVENHPYTEVVREVEVMKRELSKIRRDMSRALENESQRKEDAKKFSSLIEETRKKISSLSLREEIEQTKDLEDEVAITTLDVDVLQNELDLIKEMDKRVESSANLKNSDLLSVTKDLEYAKKEFELIKGGGFQLMTSMDATRNKLKNILEEKDQMKKLEENTENSIKNLNSELLIAKEKLEVASSSEEKAKLIFSSLSFALEKSEAKKVAERKEREVIRDETVRIKTEIQKTESETDSTEEKLQAAVQELTMVKSAEEKALKELKALVENAARTKASENKPTITISRCEYDYLTESAVGAREMADKKVAAAHAWAEALKASEREIRIKISSVERDIKEMMWNEEQMIHALDKLLKEKELDERELQNVRRQGNKSLQGRKSMRENGYNLTRMREAKFRRFDGSPSAKRANSSSSFTMKRRRKVVLKIAKCFAGKKIENEKEVLIRKERVNNHHAPSM